VTCENCGTRHKHPNARLCSECDTAERMSAAHDKEIADLETKLAAAEARAARAERERDDTLTIRSCECGVEEACRLVRERDKASAEAARYREALERIGRMTQPWNAPEIARAALARQDKP
jgi:hypothetical protein